MGRTRQSPRHASCRPVRTRSQAQKMPPSFTLVTPSGPCISLRHSCVDTKHVHRPRTGSVSVFRGVMRVGAAVGGQFRSPISRLHPGRVTQHPLFARPAGQVLPGRLSAYAAAPTGHERWLQRSWTFPVAICPATSLKLHFGAAKPSTAGRGKNATIAPRNSCPRRFWELDANRPRDTWVCVLVTAVGC